MEEIIFEILAAIFGALSEAFLQIAMEAILLLLSHAVAGLFEDSPMKNPVLATAGYLTFGIIAGGLSLLVFPHPLVHPSRFHGISLLVSPLMTGSAMAMVGYLLRRQGRQAAQIESFAYGFAFAMGMAVIRFIFAK